MNVLFVTGSRKLVDRGTGCFLAYERIINELLANTDLLVAGDARGPDQWAIMANACPFERWSLGGIVFRRYHQSTPTRSSLKQNAIRTASSATAQDGGECSRPVSTCDTARTSSASVSSIRLTHDGTDHTLGLARRAGIWTARYVWRNERFVEES